jgi:hypothetical protein
VRSHVRALEEDLLQDLLTLGAIDQHAEDQTEHPRGQQIVERGEGALVAVRRQRERFVRGIGARAVIRYLDSIDDHRVKHAPSTSVPPPSRACESLHRGCSPRLPEGE